MQVTIVSFSEIISICDYNKPCMSVVKIYFRGLSLRSGNLPLRQGLTPPRGVKPCFREDGSGDVSIIVRGLLMSGTQQT